MNKYKKYVHGCYVLFWGIKGYYGYYYYTGSLAWLFEYLNINITDKTIIANTKHIMNLVAVGLS